MVETTWRTLAILMVGTSLAMGQAARMNQVVEGAVSSGQYMGSVLVARDGEVLLNKGYGSANLEWGIPNTPETKFRLGSVTKQFTSAAILLLEDRGKLKIEDPVRKYIPEAPEAWKDITIFHCLTHTSGLYDFTRLPEYRSIEPLPIASEKLMATFRDRPLDFPPGTQLKYSNSGYAVLGMVVEKVTGETYAKFIQDNIFTPLGMKDTMYDSNSSIVPQRASGYVRGRDGLENARFIHMTVPFAAGGLRSTTGDLLRWEQALFGGKLLSAAAIRKITTPFKGVEALGLQVSITNGQRAIEHSGVIEGFTAHLAYYPQDKLTVVVLGNLQGAAVPQIARRLAIVANGGKVTLPGEKKEIHVDGEVLDRYTGVYRLPSGDSIAIQRRGEQLSALLVGSRSDDIYPESETAFFLKSVDVEIEFPATAPQQKAAQLIMQQGGPDLVGIRLSEAEARPILDSIKPPG